MSQFLEALADAWLRTAYKTDTLRKLSTKADNEQT